MSAPRRGARRRVSQRRGRRGTGGGRHPPGRGAVGRRAAALPRPRRATGRVARGSRRRRAAVPPSGVVARRVADALVVAPADGGGGGAQPARHAAALEAPVVSLRPISGGHQRAGRAPRRPALAAFRTGRVVAAEGGARR
ncbi:hypothetical protein BU14_0523s0012 [Porphyra umbilicalis]|uniref:Uncharacterized protein n=1 Tax=Porphyra umbilicalis TaxID=2786 RepID=A0A1X6NSJ5_PORUM|nr:hypothetical protein BU14_0523s0012 [Porphyra umbilicalis]|eukprot:OSX71545.1 hypothetical protein BU14_0523s0012 [Porphyra umbilicalis]